MDEPTTQHDILKTAIRTSMLTPEHCVMAYQELAALRAHLADKVTAIVNSDPVVTEQREEISRLKVELADRDQRFLNEARVTEEARQGLAGRDDLLRGAHSILRLMHSDDGAQAWVTRHMQYRLQHPFVGDPE